MELNRKFNFDVIFSNIFWVISNVFIFDLVFGGAGTYLYIGKFSIRKIIFLITLIIMLVQLSYNYYNNIKLNILTNRNLNLMAIILLVFFLSMIHGISNGFGIQAINKFLSYSTLMLLPYFLINVTDINRALKLYRLILKYIFALAIISCILFFIIIMNQDMFLNPVMKFLNDYNLGGIALIGNVPRIFLKTSILIPFGFFDEIIFLITSKSKVKLSNYIKILVYIVAIISNFTMGIWIASFISVILCLILLREQLKTWLTIKKNWYIVLFVCFSVIVLAMQFNLVSLMFDRLNVSDYSFSVKQYQIIGLLSQFMHSPIIGNGFGELISIDFMGSQITSINWEVMWIELLVNTGIVGFVSYVSIYILNCTYAFKSFKIYRSEQRFILLNLFIYIIYLLIVSFSNPFQNNPIGIGIFVLIVAIINIFYKNIKESRSVA